MISLWCLPLSLFIHCPIELETVKLDIIIFYPIMLFWWKFLKATNLQTRSFNARIGHKEPLDVHSYSSSSASTLQYMHCCSEISNCEQEAVRRLMARADVNTLLQSLQPPASRGLYVHPPSMWEWVLSGDCLSGCIEPGAWGTGKWEEICEGKEAAWNAFIYLLGV